MTTRAPVGRGGPLAVAVASLMVVMMSSVPVHGSFPGSVAGIAFQRGLDFYSADADGSNVQLFLPGSQYPQFSPDGTRIAFVGFCGCPWYTDDIYVANADGSGRTRITPWNGHDGQPRWSPDGTRLAYVRAIQENTEPSPIEMWVMDADGSGGRRLTGTDIRGSGPDWSPDGRRIVFTSPVSNGMGDLFMIDVDGGDLTQLTQLPDTGAGSPSFSPDGRRVAFSQYDPATQTYGIAVLNLQSGRIRAVTEGLNAISPQWSPDGDAILFWANQPDGTSIYQVRPNGKRLTRIVQGTWGIWRPGP